jgi:hypothetical protein
LSFRHDASVWSCSLSFKPCARSAAKKGHCWQLDSREFALLSCKILSWTSHVWLATFYRKCLAQASDWGGHIEGAVRVHCCVSTPRMTRFLPEMLWPGKLSLPAFCTNRGPCRGMSLVADDCCFEMYFKVLAQVTDTLLPITAVLHLQFQVQVRLLPLERAAVNWGGCSALRRLDMRIGRVTCWSQRVQMLLRAFR